MQQPLPDRLLAVADLLAIAAEMRERHVANYFKSNTLLAWANRIEAAAALSGGEAEVERLRVQLAGCGVLAMCNTRASLEAQQFKPGDYGWSSSLGEVIAAAEREIALREQLATTLQGDGAVVEYEFEVWQRDGWQAGGSCADLETARAEANHYAAVYSQDGPVTIRLYEKREIAAAPSAKGVA